MSFVNREKKTVEVTCGCWKLSRETVKAGEKKE
jgi:hypothetical protein